MSNYLKMFFPEPKMYFMTLIKYTIKLTGITKINNSRSNGCNIYSCSSSNTSSVTTVPFKAQIK
jgi:hypothetical protein